MAKTKTEQLDLTLTGGNISQLKVDLQRDRADYLDNLDRIKELQDANKAIRKRVIARGISAKAFARQMERAAMEENKREQYDLGYEIAAEAFGVPLNERKPAVELTFVESKENVEFVKPLDEEEGFDPNAVPGLKRNIN